MPRPMPPPRQLESMRELVQPRRVCARGVSSHGAFWRGFRDNEHSLSHQAPGAVKKGRTTA